MFAQCVHDFATSYGLGISLFVGGLVGSATHCAGMCSPFVLAQTPNGPYLVKASKNLLLPYHMGRLTTYIFLGALAHSLINLAYLFSGMKGFISAPLLALAGIIFLVSAFPQWSSVFPWVSRFKFPASFNALSSKATNLMRSQSLLSRYLLGVLLGFMPCGLVVAALLAVASASSLTQAMLGMTAFALGTMPLLIVIGVVGSTLHKKFPKFFSLFSRGAMVFSGLWLFALAGFLIF